MTLWSLYNVFNEAENLPRAMDSVEANWPEVVHVTVDGKYPDFLGDSDISTDGTRELAEARGLLLTCIDYECEKRTAGLRSIDEHAVDGDFVLVLDADEEITQVFGVPTKVGSFSFTRESRPEVQYGRCRLFRWQPGLHFRDRHYDLYDSKGNLISSLEDAPDFQMIGFGIHHDASHDETRRERKKNYYRNLRIREGHPARGAVA